MISLLIKYVNILVVVFAVIYAWRFISLTQEDSARKPWEYLMAAIVILLFVQTIEFTGWDINPLLIQLLMLCLAGLLLLVFVMQDFFMKKENYEVLRRKEMIPVQKKMENLRK